MYVSLLKKLPVAVAAIMLIIGIITVYFRSKNVTRSEFIRIFKNAKYIQAWVLVTVFVLTSVFGLFNYLNSKKSVYAVITLNYSEASQAQNSNGTRYNMAEITCDEVLKRAIKKGALEKVSAKDLKKCLSVSPYVQGDVKDETNYHISTEFIVTYCANKDTQHLNSENVIKLIVSAYKDYYIEKYTDNFKIDTAQEKPDYSTMEYMDIVLYFDKEASSVLNYLYAMAGKSQGFVTDNNTTFNSIAGKVFQFKETQIDENLKSLILQYGIARDKSGYIDRLSYQNKNTDFDRQKNAASFSLCNSAIGMYSAEMTRVVLVPTWDTSGKYYMGRTKVGIDELSVKATDFSNRVASNEKEIMDNDLIINKMQASSVDSAVNAEADSLIASIDESIKLFADEAIAAGREYSNYRMNQCIALSIAGTSFFGGLKSVAVFALFAYIAVILYAISKEFPERE